MQVILLERVAKLGQMGDVVTVKDGYARNFLFPQNKAVKATLQNHRMLEQEKAKFVLNLAKQRLQSVTDYLVKEKKVEASQVVTCQPHLVRNDEPKQIVKIYL